MMDLYQVLAVVAAATTAVLGVVAIASSISQADEASSRLATLSQLMQQDPDPRRIMTVSMSVEAIANFYIYAAAIYTFAPEYKIPLLLLALLCCFFFYATPYVLSWFGQIPHLVTIGLYFVLSFTTQYLISFSLLHSMAEVGWLMIAVITWNLLTTVCLVLTFHRRGYFELIYSMMTIGFFGLLTYAIISA